MMRGRVSGVSVRSVWLVVCVALLPGCVLQEIAENQLLIVERLDRTNASLDAISLQLHELALTNDLLIDLHAGLGTGVDRRAEVQAERAQRSGRSSEISMIATMESINEYLQRMDAHMASLRGTIQNIDRAIPFLRIASKDEEEGAEGDAAAEGGVESTDVEGGRPAPPPGAPRLDDPARDPGPRGEPRRR